MAMRPTRYETCAERECPKQVECTCWCYEHLATGCDDLECRHPAHECEAPAHYCDKHREEPA